MCQLDTVKELDIGKTYLNRKRTKEFTDYIAKIHMNNIKNSIDQAKFVSIMSRAIFTHASYESLKHLAWAKFISYCYMCMLMNSLVLKVNAV